MAGRQPGGRSPHAGAEVGGCGGEGGGVGCARVVEGGRGSLEEDLPMRGLRWVCEGGVGGGRGRLRGAGAAWRKISPCGGRGERSHAEGAREGWDASRPAAAPPLLHSCPPPIHPAPTNPPATLPPTRAARCSTSTTFWCPRQTPTSYQSSLSSASCRAPWGGWWRGSSSTGEGGGWWVGEGGGGRGGEAGEVGGRVGEAGEVGGRVR